MRSWLLSGLVWSLLQLSRRRLLFVLQRILLLPLDPLHLLLHIPLLKLRHLLLPLWISFSSGMLILIVFLTIFLMRWVRWTPRLVTSLAISLILADLLLLLHLSLLRILLMVEMKVMMVLALLVMMRWLLSMIHHLSLMTKKGSSFGYERVFMLLEGELA